MKALSCLCAAGFGALLSASAASALPLAKTQIAVPADAIVKVSHRHYHRRGGAFANWCAYNCYRVGPSARAPLGRYGYSQFAYDEDLPISPRWDRDASPVDNVLGVIHPYTGEPFLRAFERRW